MTGGKELIGKIQLHHRRLPLVSCFSTSCDYCLPVNIRCRVPALRRSDVYEIRHTVGVIALGIFGPPDGVSLSENKLEHC